MQDNVRKSRKILYRYLAIAIFCLIVSLVYSHFSHGIHSFWMRFLAVWPLIFGAVPAFLEEREIFPFRKCRTGSRTSEEGADAADDENTAADSAVDILKDIYRFGIAAVTAASFLNGVLEIAGTGSYYPAVLLSAGIVMLLCGAAGVLFLLHKKRRG